MARPRGGDWLEDELKALRRSGVTVLVSLLEKAEVEALELSRERELWVGHGLAFYSHPVPDYAVPTSAPAFTKLAIQLAETLQAGHAVAIHCRMGIGRSSLLAAAILARAGVPLNDDWLRISVSRGLHVPDTDEQQRRLEENI